MHRWFPCLLLGLSLNGCCRSSSEDTRPTETSAAGSPDEAAPPASAAPTTAPDGLPLDIPSARTPAPTMSEWQAVRPLQVRSAMPLGCRVSMIREWVRVVCAGSRRSGGPLQNLAVKGGCSPDTSTTMRREATLVTTLAQGSRCEVNFQWADGVSTFVADWATRARPSLLFVPVAGPGASASAAPRFINPQVPVRR